MLVDLTLSYEGGGDRIVWDFDRLLRVRLSDEEERRRIVQKVDDKLREELAHDWQEQKGENLWEVLHKVVTDVAEGQFGKGGMPKVQAPLELRMQQQEALERRRELRAEYAGRMTQNGCGTLMLVVQAWRVAAQLTRATRIVKQAQRREFQEVRKQLEEQLSEAWERGLGETQHGRVLAAGKMRGRNEMSVWGSG